MVDDRETGIGRWSDAEFVRAVHRGIGKNGEDLYPAFPYTAYALLSTDDVLAIRAYLSTVRPVSLRNTGNTLVFPFNQGYSLRAWKLFVPTRPWEPSVAHGATWNVARHVRFDSRHPELRVRLMLAGNVVKCGVSDNESAPESIRHGRGLTIVRELASSLGGRVHTSCAAEGSSFLLTFPLTEAEQCAAGATHDVLKRRKMGRPRRLTCTRGVLLRHLRSGHRRQEGRNLRFPRETRAAVSWAVNFKRKQSR